jgi:hypothetical protein
VRSTRQQRDRRRARFIPRERLAFSGRFSRRV